MQNFRLNIEKCINSLGEKFLKYPFNFFTESDAHSFLYYYIFRSGARSLKIPYSSRDGTKTVLIHREYPTSFRFFRQNMELSESGVRGHYDLGILNPEFIANHLMDEIIAKDFKKCKVSEKHHLLAAIEFKLIVNPLNANLRTEIRKDFKKLSLGLDQDQTKNAYLILFNRCRHENTFIDELRKLSKSDDRIQVLYIESIKKPHRHYEVLYFNEWTGY